MQFLPLAAALSATILSLGTQATSTFEPARPPSIPLAVKSPYFNTWLNSGSDGGDGGYLPGEWPTFWSGQVTGWAGIIRVDGTSYTWLGAPTGTGGVADQTSFEYTSTRSSFILSVAGKVEMNVTFLSPLTPEDFKRQSLTMMYLDVSVQSLDGDSHKVELYSDISAEWVAGDHSQVAQWEYGTTGDIAYHKVWKQTQLAFTETNQQADWGYWYWSTENVRTLTYQSGADNTVRGQFINSGDLDNSNDTDYRAINDDYPVFGFAFDFGTLSASSQPSALFTIGLAQEQAIQFTGADGKVQVPSLWTSYFSDELAALEFFYSDYSTAASTATAFDNQVASDSMAAAGQSYLTVTSLAARQAFAGVQLTGTTDKQYLFLKEISSDGDIQTVDVIFPFHPILMYANPDLLRIMLDPLFENQESGNYPNDYSMHDMGAYPNATGYPSGNDEQQPLEECGNMLIMTLAYAQAAQDSDYLSQHYDILNQWTGYLINEALIPADQISTDDFAGSLANQTNLALKGMIGIQAMAVIANMTGNSADYKNYSSIASSYIEQWYTLGVAQDASPAHTTLGYGLNDTHGLLYNLYGDAELGTNLVKQEIYDMQSAFYPTVEETYGVPLDTRHNYTKSDWEMFAAAIASTDTKTMFIDDLANWINETPTNIPETDIYDSIGGDFGDGIMFAARPVVGGHFALLALEKIQNATSYANTAAGRAKTTY